MPSRVFHLVAARVLVASAVPAAVGAWLFGAAAGVGVGAAMFTFEIWRLRRMILAAVPETLEFEAARPADHPWLDRPGFERELDELRSAGFLPIADYAARYPGSPDGFARLLVHPTHRLYAEVNQLHHPDAGEVTTTIVSEMTEGWRLQTSSRSVLTTSAAFMRAPRNAWHSIPGTTPSQLVEAHLATRAEICRMQGVTIAGDGSVQGYLNAEQSAHQARRASLTMPSVLLGLARGVRVERRPIDRWLGGIRSGAATA